MSGRSVLTIAILGAALLGTALSRAQQAPPANPLDTVNNANYLLTLEGVIASRGGIPLVEGGRLIGAIGCSGGTGSQDEVACKAGAATVK